MTKQDYNLEGRPDISQYISKYMALKIWSLKYFEQCIIGAFLYDDLYDPMGVKLRGGGGGGVN